ncbi:MAG: reverse transcriptase domain-containing protein, partial [Trichodesmium sp. St16_bin2-tuft]|nr:reverse transcriptase domain-containing protein [Trichodesmium sp. St16_bin2-tuft]
MEGTPQGGVISPLQAQTSPYMGLEERLMEFAQTLDIRNSRGFQAGWQIKCKTLNLIRYADDFVILHKDIKVVLQAKTIIQEWLSQVGLELKPEKTRIAHTLKEYEGNKPGFDFLGFTVRQWKVKSTRLGFKTLIKPSSKSTKTHYRKLAEICDKYKSAPVEALIAKLNPVIRGWANYYS